MERWKDALADALLAVHRPRGRSTSAPTPAAREREASAPVRRLAATPDGNAGARRSPCASMAGASTLDVATGHKTGFYLDQRDNRQRFADVVRRFGSLAC